MAASAYLVISTEVENHIFKPIDFLDTSAFINNQHWQSGGILIFLCKYCIVISDTLVGSYQDIMRNQERKIDLQKKVHRRICVREITFLTALHFFSCLSFCFLLLFSSIPPSHVTPLRNDTYKNTCIAMGGILCDDIISKWSKTWKSII